MRAFLSHSSKDKEHYVDSVAKKIGTDRVVYDRFTFEEGIKSIEEINRTLEISDILVVFISENSIDSDWVKYELFKANCLIQDKSKLKQIYPIIIDSRIKYDDVRIPEWLRDNNLQLIVSSNKAAGLILQRLRELSYRKHPGLEEKNRIFVGRNDVINNFEMRINDFEKDIPMAICASGFQNIGRKTAMFRALVKIDAIRDSYRLPKIELNAHESIEDLILKIDDLGMTASISKVGLLKMTVDEKVELVCGQLLNLKEEKQRLFIEDNGCIINPDRTLVNWFSKIYNKLKNIQYVLLGISSLYKIQEHLSFDYENVMFAHISELNKKERGILLAKFLEFEDVKLTREDIKYFADLLSGYPDQAHFASRLIKEIGVPLAKKKTNLIIQYNTERVIELINEYESDANTMNMLALLKEYGTIGYNTIFDIAGDNEKNSIILDNLLGKGICETFGANKEYIRINDIVCDYLIRMGLKMPEGYSEKVLNNLGDFISNNSTDEYIGNISEYQYLIRKAILEQKISEIEHLLVPSHFLQSMKMLYDVHKKYDDVIELADRVLQNENFIDQHIKNEIRYYLCMSLARNKDRRFKDEVINIGGAEHDFLFGFYYRQMGNTEKSIQRYESALRKRKPFARAQRDLVQVYLTIEDYETAYKLAKENYAQDKKNNPFHIHAYFTTTIRKSNLSNKREILDQLIEELKVNKHEKAREFYYRCKAQYEAFINNEEEKALNYIDEAAKEYPNNYRLLIDQYYICTKFKNEEKMKQIIEKYQQEYGLKRAFHNNTVMKFKILLCAIKGEQAKIPFITRELKNYPEGAVKKLIDKYCSSNEEVKGEEGA